MTQSQRALALSQSSPSVFHFGDHAVRIVVIDGEPWFVCVDVATALGYRNAPDAARHLDADEKGTHILRTLSPDEKGRGGGDQRVTIINKSGLYALVLRSRKPEARKFAKWVTSEVLPSIRKTGGYSTPRIDPAELLLSGQSDPVPLPPEVEQALHRRTWELTREAYDLIEEHLRRRVACWSYAGYPEKVINIDSALHALDTLGDLGEALAHAYLEKVDQIASYCNAMGRELRNTRETMQTLLAQHGLRASI